METLLILMAISVLPLLSMGIILLVILRILVFVAKLLKFPD